MKACALFYGFLMAMIAAPVSAAEPVSPVSLDGPLKQGGMVVGVAPSGAQVMLDGQRVAVTDDGRFVFGFHRDAPDTAVLTVTLPDGTVDERALSVEQRTYNIQRIDGLPPKKVSPPKAVQDRLKRERGMVGAARRNDAEHTYWADEFIWPVSGRISGVYGSQRVLNGQPRQPHYGIDIAAPTGTPVMAPASGTVVLAEDDFYYEGGIVIIDHGHGVMSTLFHLETVDVENGADVARGDLIGKVGATGRATGPHLDWRVNWHKARLDPALLVGPMPEP